MGEKEAVDVKAWKCILWLLVCLCGRKAFPCTGKRMLQPKQEATRAGELSNTAAAGAALHALSGQQN